jgi:hypothetical protein
VKGRENLLKEGELQQTAKWAKEIDTQMKKAI